MWVSLYFVTNHTLRDTILLSSILTPFTITPTNDHNNNNPSITSPPHHNHTTTSNHHQNALPNPNPPTLTSFPPPNPNHHPSLPQTPSPNTTSNPSPNVLLLLHPTGDTSTNLTPLAVALNLPETTTITLQAPTPLPFDLGGFHWGDDITFSPDGGLDMDAGFSRSVKVIHEVIRDVLVRKCGYKVRDVVIWGLGQGGMVGLEVARVLALKGVDGGDKDKDDGERCLGGVVSIGAPVGLDGGRSGSSSGGGVGKSKTPVLIAAGKEGDGTAVTAAGVRRTQEWFEFVEVVRYKRKGDGMPRNREEMTPIMAFLARRLRSYKGVPEGSVEIS
ncbi:hypothetical protein BO94DRAFT_619529 [Aspergillus sclerotioniger CBS 115572]|uniref:Phospholipase/carboxylesterase/thioesterase domain-containing protein n=1 Tax=Aspergillus sclerotioniger CBS 115572 TaxID=1450535 RepID=A0A317XCP8_9EURO|nr:hypothetical protein BO94DRAFT_619529 [Aspergillus sclerotioniger CBS 115572]PWY96394.1 hypothetical protein BO94DRAFT_619529 [Aspergillus sclerotioniger CBS 115572]